MLIGAQKAGTTSIAAEIYRIFDVKSQRHNAVRTRNGPKEIHYFDTHKADMSMAAYAQRFGGCSHRVNSSNRVAIINAVDYTPRYIRVAAVPLRIVETYGAELSAKLRFVLSVRNPTARLQSWYYHIGRKYHPNLPSINPFVRLAMDGISACARRDHVALDSVRALELRDCRCVEQVSCECLTGGLYHGQLQNWLGHFDPAQFLVISFGGFVEQPDTVRRDLTAFLLGPQAPMAAELALTRVEAAHKNAHRQEEDLSPRSRQRLDHFFKAHNERFIRLLRGDHDDSSGSRPPANQTFQLSPYKPDEPSFERLFLAK